MSVETEVVILDSDSDSDSVIIGDIVQRYDSDEEVDSILQRIMNIEDEDDGVAPKIPRPSNSQKSNCFNLNCKQTDLSEYINPIPLIKSIFKIPKGKHQICIGCYNEAKEIYEKRVEMLKNNEPLINGPFLKIDSVVVVSSDESEDEDNNDNDEIDAETKRKLESWITESGREFMKKLNIGKQMQHCNKYVEEKFQLTSDVYRELSEEYKEIETDLEKSMNDFYDAYRPKNTVLPELDIPISEDERQPEIVQPPQAQFRPMYGRRSTTGHSISHMIPNGSLTTSIKNPEVGERVYYARNSDDPNKEWLLGIVDKKLIKHNHGKIEEMYRIRCDDKGSDFINVDLSSLATTFRTVFQYDIGTRVIAVFSRAGFVKKGFLPGMVGELPSRQNRNRYLIFFECGPASYVHESEIYFVFRLNKCSYEYFSHACRQFMKDYVESWPRRHMENYKIKDLAYVITYGGKKKLCEVIGVDASLVNIKFLYDNTTQWIYRGSTRLIPMKKSKDGNLQNEIQILSDEEDGGESSGQASTRAVARKSVTKPSEIPLVYPRRPRERRGFRSENGKIVRNYPANLLNPKHKIEHTHSPDCVDWVLPAVKKIEDKIKSMNPLSVPSLFAFKREVQGTKVFYFTPCGSKEKECKSMLEYLSQTQLQLSIDVFDFDPKVSIFDEFVVDPQYIKIPDISMGRENVPIPCVNTLDETEPDLMEYMAERRGMEGVDIVTDPNFLVCCDCTDNCQDKEKCACWQLTIMQARLFDYKLDPNTIGYENKRLSRLLLTGIYECNQACHCCKNTCLNRVVQHPIKVKLQLYKTKKKGWGTRCVNDIPEGAFICVYNGHLLTESYANESGRQQGDEYFAELDYIEVLEDHKNDYEECPPEFSYDQDDSSVNSFRKLYGEDESVYIMDAKIAGNIGRYLNHSCDPNIFVQNVFVDTQDLRFPWIAFFALKYIRAGTELTWNYGYAIDSVPGKKLFCYCEAPNCRKRLL